MRHEDGGESTDAILDDMDDTSGCGFFGLWFITVLSAGADAASISEVCNDHSKTLSWFWVGASSASLIIAVVGLIKAARKRYGQDQEE